MIKKRNLYYDMAAFIFGCCLVALVLISAEIICRLVDVGGQHSNVAKDSQSERRYYPANYFIKDPFGVSCPLPGVHHVKSEKLKNNQVIYDVTYSIDEFGRRITPVNEQDNRDKFALFMGCSFTYGEGVNGNETIPYYFGQAAPEFRPYNYAFHGLGPFDWLTKLRNYDFAKQIDLRQGSLIYIFHDCHVERAEGSLSYLLWKKEAIYYKEILPGVFKRWGTFQSGRPWTNFFYTQLLKSRLFKALGLNMPLIIGKGSLAKTARVIEAMYAAFKKQYPAGVFYYVIYPGSGYGREVANFFSKSEIQVLDFTQLFDHSESKFHLRELSAHPSALANKLLGTAIAEKIYGLNH